MLTSSLVPFQFLCQLWISFTLLFGNDIKCWRGSIYFKFPKSCESFLDNQTFFGVQVPDVNCSSYGAWSHPGSYFDTAAFLVWLDQNAVYLLFSAHDWIVKWVFRTVGDFVHLNRILIVGVFFFKVKDVMGLRF